MNFQDKINNDLKEAMKAKDEKALRAIRAIKAAILLANTDGSGLEMNDERGLQIVSKLVKQRKESLEIYEKQGREDLAVTEREEIEVISRYLPAVSYTHLDVYKRQVNTLTRFNTSLSSGIAMSIQKFIVSNIITA